MADELVTKSVRLTPQESAALAELAARLHCSEGSLLRRFTAEGLRQAQLGEGILGYVRGQATLAQAADIAHLSEDAFEEQLRLRGILGPGALGGEGADDAELFLSSLRQVAESVGSQSLLQALERTQRRRRKPAARR